MDNSVELHATHLSHVVVLNVGEQGHQHKISGGRLSKAYATASSEVEVDSQCTTFCTAHADPHGMGGPSMNLTCPLPCLMYLAGSSDQVHAPPCSRRSRACGCDDPHDRGGGLCR
jgi:hypothetical protein